MLSYQELVTRAIGVLPMAYAPYSRFSVGAALQDTRGRVFLGCNVENASYGATLCAERAALAAAVAAGSRDFAALAVVSSGPGVCLPCGLCRQVLAEFTPGLTILCAEPNGAFQVYTLAELLPHRFALRA